MNERIALLINRATTVEKGPPNWDLTANTVITTFDKEKFAELLIKECVNQIHVADVGDLKGKAYYLDKVAEHVEQHFGVKE